MASVMVRLPSVMDPIVEGKRSFSIEVETLADVVARLREEPKLGGHLFDESGAFRPHVLCFHNETNLRWLEDLSMRVKEGDTITILQAVSGG